VLIHPFKSLGIFDGQSQLLSKFVVRSVARKIDPVETELKQKYEIREELGYDFYHSPETSVPATG